VEETCGLETKTNRLQFLTPLLIPASRAVV